MTNRNWLVVLIACFLSAQLMAQDPASFEWVKKVGARKYPSVKKTYIANKYGAVSDTITVNTIAIQKALDACAKAGGGVVSFQPGTYVTGSLFIKSNTELRIGEGVLLLGSQNFADYPEMDTRIAGIEMKWPAALINVVGQKNVAITGKGKINARGKFCWDKYWAMRKDYDARGLRWIVDYDAKRVRTILVQESADVTLRGLTISNAGFWTVQLLYSAYLTVDGLVIRNNEDGKGPSTDGVDVDSSTWTLIENCDIDCNDDDFCLKSGRDWDGLRVNRPTEYVVIRKCIARKGGGLLTLGSETSGGIRHVLATDITASETGNCFHIKSAVTRGGIVEDIYFQHVTGTGVKNGFHFTMNWNPSYSYSKLPAGYNADSIPEHWKKLLRMPEPAEKGIPTFRNIHISNVTITNARVGLLAAGMEASYLKDFYFTNVKVEAAEAGSVSFAEDWKLNGLKISSANNKPVLIEKSKGVGAVL